MSEAISPAKAPSQPLALCPECGKQFPVKSHLYTFCEPAHKRAWNNRMLARGGSLMLLAMASRQGRANWKEAYVAKAALIEFRSALDQFAREDKAAGRPSALVVLGNRYRAQGINVIEAAPKRKPRGQAESAPNP